MWGGLWFPFSSIYMGDGDDYTFIFAFSPVLKMKILSALEDAYPERFKGSQEQSDKQCISKSV